MASRPEAVIVAAARTPVGRFLGALAPLSATALGAAAVREVIRRAGLLSTDAGAVDGIVEPALTPPSAPLSRRAGEGPGVRASPIVDEVILGNVVSAGLGQAPARQAAIAAGLPPSVPCTTVNKVCGSSLKAVMLAAQAIRAGDGSAYVAGGMESMSNAPYLLQQARSGYRLGHGSLVDANIQDGLWCSFEQQHMGNSAEYIAEEFGISREEMDRYALASHRKAVDATRAGRFAAEIVPVEVPQRKGPALLVEADEGPRPDTSLEALARLAPAFVPGGKVTAGNSPGLSDGAAAVVVMEAEAAYRRDLQPLARITGYATCAVEPRRIFAAPAGAIRRLLAASGADLSDFDLLEVNEAFAAQILANGKDLGWDWERVNVNGGAVALGHPLGATGARILTTLLYALKDRGLRRGLAALCLGGGEAVALGVEVAG